MSWSLVGKVALILGVVEAAAYLGVAFMPDDKLDAWFWLRGAAIGLLGLAGFFALSKMLFKKILDEYEILPLVVAAFLFLPLFWGLSALVWGHLWPGKKPILIHMPLFFLVTAVSAEILRRLVQWTRFRQTFERRSARRRIVALHWGLVPAIALYEMLFDFALWRAPQLWLKTGFFLPLVLWFVFGAACAAIAASALLLWEKVGGPRFWVKSIEGQVES